MGKMMVQLLVLVCDCGVEVYNGMEVVVVEEGGSGISVYLKNKWQL